MAVDAPPIAKQQLANAHWCELGALMTSLMTSLMTHLSAPLIASLFAEQLANALRANSARVLDLFRSWDADGDGQVSTSECNHRV